MLSIDHQLRLVTAALYHVAMNSAVDAFQISIPWAHSFLSYRATKSAVHSAIHRHSRCFLVSPETNYFLIIFYWSVSFNGGLGNWNHYYALSPWSFFFFLYSEICRFFMVYAYDAYVGWVVTGGVDGFFSLSCCLERETTALMTWFESVTKRLDSSALSCSSATTHPELITITRY